MKSPRHGYKNGLPRIGDNRTDTQVWSPFTMPHTHCCLFRTLCFLAVLSTAAAAVQWRQIESAPDGVLPTPFPQVEPTASLTVDVDNDGDADLVVGGRNSGPALTLWRFDAGRWTSEVIEPDNVHVEAGGAVHDIDGDGDLDIAFGGDYRGNEIWWWENPGDAKGRWTRHTVKRNAYLNHHDQIFGDFDGDGKIEFVSWNQSDRALLRFVIPADPKNGELWAVEKIFTWPETGYSHEGLAKADVDGDGVDDIVGGGYWFHHTGAGHFAAEQVDPAMSFTRSAVGHFVKGGRPELVYVPGDADGPLNWYEWKNEQWITHTLLDHVIHGHSLQVADIDGDGNDDILVGEMGSWSDRTNNPNARVLVFFGDGQGRFTKQLVSQDQGVHETRLADLNGDGRLDIFAKPFRHNAPRLVVWLNEGNISPPLPLNQWKRHLIDPALAGDNKRIFLETADLDGDGYRDIIAGPTWHRNPGVAGGAWRRRIIGEGFGNLATSHDFDRDGDIDLLGTTGGFLGNQFVLALNDGSGAFTLRRDLPAGSGDFLQGIAAGRLTNGVTSVVLSWHENKNGIEALILPDDAATGTWELRTLSTFSRNEQVSVGDVDRDASADILLGDYWLRNTEKSWTLHRIGTVRDLNPQAEVDRNRLADLNGDGRLDAVVSLELDSHIVWFEQPALALGPWTRHLIGTVPGMGFSMDVADFDADGDLDVVVGEHRNPDKNNRVLLFENQDGDGEKWIQHVIDQGAAEDIDHHDGTLAVDIDGDGDTDIVSIGFYQSKVWLLENQAIARPRK